MTILQQNHMEFVPYSRLVKCNICYFHIFRNSITTKYKGILICSLQQTLYYL